MHKFSDEIVLSVASELLCLLRIAEGSAVDVGGKFNAEWKTEHWKNKRNIQSAIIPRIALSPFSLSDLVSGLNRDKAARILK